MHDHLRQPSALSHGLESRIGGRADGRRPVPSTLATARASGNGSGGGDRTLVAMRQPGALSRTVLALCWLVVGAAMVAVAGWLGWTRGTVLLAGHPAAVVLGLAAGLLGFVALAWAVASLAIGEFQGVIAPITPIGS